MENVLRTSVRKYIAYTVIYYQNAIIGSQTLQPCHSVSLFSEYIIYKPTSNQHTLSTLTLFTKIYWPIHQFTSNQNIFCSHSHSLPKFSGLFTSSPLTKIYCTHSHSLPKCSIHQFTFNQIRLSTLTLFVEM